ncbi:PQQ-dependent sugar dehydrogenase [Asanoa siamensis]|uniref:PKD domain-containing protein n=1 Tax=Asanoa siamensis TaxID=926357 RepID=A0ABQ4CVN3_9ACTN|nr:PQQ-dependent sugar dehydrogenase [Asanoa siamensis]GIF75083.1 hypothetical protein Asi02nite_46010 [Asanoa siamensis]
MRKKLALFVAPLLAVSGGAVSWSPATAAPPGGPPADSNFQKVTLNDFPGEPMSLAVLPDNRVLHTARTGEVRIHDPRSGLNILAADVPVYEHDEEGLQGVAIDPDFSRNKWVYLYYSPVLDTPVDDPATPDVNEGDAPFEGTPEDFAPFKGHLQLSRFKLEGNSLKLDTEQKIIQVATDRGICCHVGGQIDFDGKGNLYLSTGDDTNPFFSDGYVPIDERANRNPAFDAQRTSANTNDLRGKLLRIRVKPNGGYTVPSGNLFRAGTPKTRPEIFAMGFRNPFRFAVNRQTNDVYVGDYSPDAGEPDPARGPAGHGRWMRVDKPANYGWPYCVGPDLAYVDYDFATGTSGAPFDCRRPVNNSPHNTGLTRLPPVEKAEVNYSYGVSQEFPELGEGGIGPMGGPAYDYDRRNKSRVKWPEYYDGVPLFYEWSRDYTKEFRLDRRGNVDDIRPVLPSLVFDNPMDMEFGPDGALYVLEYGDGFFSENPDAQLARFDFVRGNRTPIPVISAAPLAGDPPLVVQFSSAGTVDPDGDPLRYAWDFNADGRVDSTAPNPSYTFTAAGTYRPTLKVTDSTGRSASAEIPEFVVGPRPPEVELVQPADGQPFEFGDTVTFEVSVVDNDPVNCANVTVNYILGHDEHGHPITSATGCTGTITTSAPGHGPGDDLFGVFVATYTDPDGLTGTDQVVLTPSATP